MRIAIVGTGQLARMLALEGWAMGLEFSFLATKDETSDCVNGLGPIVRYIPGMAASDIYEQMGRPDVITVEKENLDTVLLKALQAYCPVYPDPSIIHICQHRGREREFLDSIGVPCAVYEKVNSLDELYEAVERIGFPAILKACEAGYDGLNQWRLESLADIGNKFNKSGKFVPAILERCVPFSREVSILLVRSVSGDHFVYPLTENYHRHGVLLTSIAPAPGVDARLLSQVDRLVERFVQAWDYVGVLAIECFEIESGLIVNELAPRVHNSGHWTQLGAYTSQFENHLRAISAVRLGDTRATSFTGMINLLGRSTPAEFYYQVNSQVHLYNKAARPGRKTGHINFIHSERETLAKQMQNTLELIYGSSSEKIGGVTPESSGTSTERPNSIVA